MSEAVRDFVVPAGHARLWRMRAGEQVTIAQTEGHQVGDLIAFNAVDLTEFLSPSHTRRCLAAWRIGAGQSLFTNHRREIFDLVEDSVGTHDILAPACDPYRYRRDFGVEDHRSCRMNFVEALAPYAIPDWRVPDPVNLFQHSPVLPDGQYLAAPSPARPGDHVTLAARLDLIAVLSACPQDLAPTNAGRVTDLRVRLAPI